MTGDVLCLSHVRWGAGFQRPHHLMTRCARERRVFFVEEPAFDARSPRLDVERKADGLHVAVPHLAPGTLPEEAERLQRALVEGLAVRANVREPLFWFYTPAALDVVRDLRAGFVVYDCVDAPCRFGPEPLARAREQALLARADVVFTAGRGLHEAKRVEHPEVHLLPHGVDAAHFGWERARDLDPLDQRDLPHPRLGYFGAIDDRIDFALLRALATARRDCSIVMIGPTSRIDPATLPRLPNLHYLGQKRYEELPAYIAAWDVAILPYAHGDATRLSAPTKTLEYLAAGKPVVATSIRDVVHPFGERGLVRIADDAPTFAAAVRAALAEDGTLAGFSRRDACDAIVAHASWDRVWARMNMVVAEARARRAREIAVGVLGAEY
ncbi:MAG: glycosyltransferase [Labilithrix sp.]|nr:glycosyltransferase [Labilithrix sp.]